MLILAHTYYRLERYKKAKSILKSIKSKKPKIKQRILYELGNCEAKLAYYDKAKEYYIKSLAFGEDSDTLYNLGVVIFLKQRYKSKLGFTNPNSPQPSTQSKDNREVEDKPNSKKEEKVGSSGGSGSKVSKNSSIKVVKSDSKTKSKREMSSRAYDLINQGYIKESRPW
jgi:Ca-activated chloride channel family protein